MKKRGFLLAEETLKIVIAVICIGFLVYFLTSLYLKNKDSEKLEQAKASLEYLVSEINLKQPEVEIYNPNGWVISSWSSVGEMPSQCINFGWSNCLCICDNVGVIKEYWSKLPLTDSLQENILSKCDSNGRCLQSDFSVENNFIEIKKPLPIKLKIDYDGKIIK